jgi:NTE family protein
MRALCLSGGGSKGSFQTGVLKRWMFEESNDYQIMCGISVGSLNVAALSQVPYGKPQLAWQKLNNIWQDITTEKVCKEWFPFQKVSGLWKMSLMNSQPLIHYVNEKLDTTACKSSGRIVHVGATCLDTGEFKFGTNQDDNFADWVLASSSFPVFFNPITIDGKNWSDGGIVTITPIEQAIKLGADDIDVIMCNNPNLKEPWTDYKHRALPDILLRVIDLMSTEVGRNDLTNVGIGSDIVRLIDKYKNIKVRLVEPKAAIPFSSLDFNHENILKMIDMGYEASNSYQLF